MTDHNVSTLGDKKGDHWVIYAHVFPVNTEKGEPNIYSSKHIAKMEEQLTARAKSKQDDVKPSAKSTDGKIIAAIHDCSGSSGKDNTSSKDSVSIGSDTGGVSSNGLDKTSLSLSALDDEAGSGRKTDESGTSQYFGSR